MSADTTHATIRTCVWPADQADASILLRNYQAHLLAPRPGVSPIAPDGYEWELAHLATVWSPPRGMLLIALLQGRAAGCVGLSMRPAEGSTTCEMKRLWVERDARGHGLGRHLVTAAAQQARAMGAETLLLDTVAEAMPAAMALYRALGFVETQRHNNNAVPGLTFMKLDLFPGRATVQTPAAEQ